jgi:hypothetical protein
MSETAIWCRIAQRGTLSRMSPNDAIDGEALRRRPRTALR